LLLASLTRSRNFAAPGAVSALAAQERGPGVHQQGAAGPELEQGGDAGAEGEVFFLCHLPGGLGHILKFGCGIIGSQWPHFEQTLLSAPKRKVWFANRHLFFPSNGLGLLTTKSPLVPAAQSPRHLARLLKDILAFMR
jgi:hypothetical protein